MIFSQILQQKFQPGLINSPPNSQTDLPHFQWLVTSDLPVIAQGGLTPKPRLLGEHVGKTWPGATRAGHSHLWRQQLWLQEGAQLTQTSCCVPMATKVSCSSPSHFWEKKDRGLMEKTPRVPMGCAELGQIFNTIAGTTHPRPAGKGSPVVAHGFKQDGEWDSNTSSQIQNGYSSRLLCSVSLWTRDTQSTHHSYRSYWMLTEEVSAPPILFPIWHDLGMKVLISHHCSVTY